MPDIPLEDQGWWQLLNTLEAAQTSARWNLSTALRALGRGDLDAAKILCGEARCDHDRGTQVIKHVEDRVARAQADAPEEVPDAA